MGTLTAQDVLDFEQAQIALIKAKSVEIELRKKIINHFRYGSNLEGVQHKSIEGLEMDIVVTLKLGRTLDKDALKTIWADLSEEQRDTIEYKPSLDLKAYKQLLTNDAAGELINVVTEKPGLASVTLKYEE